MKLKINNVEMEFNLARISPKDFFIFTYNIIIDDNCSSDMEYELFDEFINGYVNLEERIKFIDELLNGHYMDYGSTDILFKNNAIIGHCESLYNGFTNRIKKVIN